MKIIKKKENAIELGKKRNAAKIAYEKDKRNKSLKRSYTEADKEYKKSLRGNTTYRKGTIRQEVGRDASRKYLSEAKKVKKQLDSDPRNKSLKRKYNDLMSKHDIERADARKAVTVGEKRSRKKAAMKRAMTVSVKTAITSAAIAGGVYAANRYLNDKGSLNINSEQVANMIKNGKKLFSYMY